MESRPSKEVPAFYFYVQDERYTAVAWMHKSGYVQDERYTAVAWMPKSGYVQDERYTAVAWMPKSGYVQDERAEKDSCVFDTSAIPSDRIPRRHTQRAQVDI